MGAALERDGEGLYPLLDAAIAADPEGLGRRVRVEIYRRLGYFPTESSEHFGEYVPWFMRDDDEIERLRIPVDEYVRRSEENLDLYEQEKRKLAAGERFDIERSQEYASLIIHSMVAGVARTVYGNVRNTGLITNLPQAACVEVPCLVDRAGLQPTVVGQLPPTVRRPGPRLPQRGRAHGAGGPRATPRPRAARDDARSERRGHTFAERDRSAGRRDDGG